MSVTAALQGRGSGKRAPCLSARLPDALREASAELDGWGGGGKFCAASGGAIFRAEPELQTVRADSPELGWVLETFSCIFGVRSPGLAACAPNGRVLGVGICCRGEVWKGGDKLVTSIGSTSSSFF